MPANHSTYRFNTNNKNYIQLLTTYNKACLIQQINTAHASIEPCDDPESDIDEKYFFNLTALEDLLKKYNVEGDVVVHTCAHNGMSGVDLLPSLENHVMPFLKETSEDKKQKMHQTAYNAFSHLMQQRGLSYDFPNLQVIITSYAPGIILNNATEAALLIQMLNDFIQSPPKHLNPNMKIDSSPLRALHLPNREAFLVQHVNLPILVKYNNVQEKPDDIKYVGRKGSAVRILPVDLLAFDIDDGFVNAEQYGYEFLNSEYFNPWKDSQYQSELFPLKLNLQADANLQAAATPNKKISSTLFGTVDKKNKMEEIEVKQSASLKQ